VRGAAGDVPPVRAAGEARHPVSVPGVSGDRHHRRRGPAPLCGPTAAGHRWRAPERARSGDGPVPTELARPRRRWCRSPLTPGTDTGCRASPAARTGGTSPAAPRTRGPEGRAVSRRPSRWGSCRRRQFLEPGAFRPGQGLGRENGCARRCHSPCRPAPTTARWTGPAARLFLAPRTPGRPLRAGLQPGDQPAQHLGERLRRMDRRVVAPRDAVAAPGPPVPGRRSSRACAARRASPACAAPRIPLRTRARRPAPLPARPARRPAGPDRAPGPRARCRAARTDGPRSPGARKGESFQALAQ